MGLLNSFFGSTGGPIGIDLGSDVLRAAQVMPRKQGPSELVAAAELPVPEECRRDPAARVGFFQRNVRELIAGNGFRGRRVVLSLPASCMHIGRLRLPRMEPDVLRKSIVWEARGKLPIDPAKAMLRHVVAGEVYENQEPLSEVIVMAAARELMHRFLDAAGAAKLDVTEMTAEPQAVLDCYNHVLSGTPQAGITRMYIDVGGSATRAYVARGPQMLFARVAPVGCSEFDQSIAQTLKISLADARELRRRRAIDASAAIPPLQAVPREDAQQQEEDSAAGGAATAVAAPPTPRTTASAQDRNIDLACTKPLRALVTELELCVRYYEHTFPTSPVEQVVFVGGGAIHTKLCRAISAGLRIPVESINPMSRIVRAAGGSSALDLSQTHPAWAVALGLSLGAAT